MKLRVLIHAQSLTGVGHWVRAREIARELARAHDVHLVDGGRPVPGRACPPGVEPIELPRLARGAGGLVALDTGLALPDALSQRRDVLACAAERVAPDVVVVEHFPFSKRELRAEILALLGAARRARPGALVVASVRDVCPRIARDGADAASWERDVLADLAERFDALLVHADPGFTRLDEHFPAAGRIRVPVVYTGFVSEESAEPAPARERANGPVVASFGGGVGSARLALVCAAAWRELEARGASGGRRLALFEGLHWNERERASVRERLAGSSADVRPFDADLGSWLARASLSVARAGYNTCAALLRAECPALLVPNAAMSDQAFRARRLAELGLARTLDERALEPGPQALVDALSSALADGARTHSASAPLGAARLDLDGARGTRLAIEDLADRAARKASAARSSS